MRILAILAAGAAILWAQPASFEGSWNGVLDAGMTKLRIGLNIKNAEGKLSATLDSPDQGAYGIPLDSVAADGNKIRFAKQALTLSYEGELKGERIEGTFTQGGQNFPLAFERGKPQAANRPQYPKPPLPYDAEEVTVASGEIRLAGTFTHPKQGAPFAALLLVTGSGPEDRDETVFDQKPFLVISDYLTRAGYAILRLDDRGTGKSSGDFQAAGLAEFTGDALAAVAWLKARSDVRKDAIGILGHSEGGMVGPLAAVRSGDVAFVIMLAGPAQPFEDLMMEQVTGLMRASGAPDSAIAVNVGMERQIYAVLSSEPDEVKARQRLDQLIAEWKKTNPQAAAQVEAGLPRLLSREIRSAFAYKAADTLSKLRCPVLALYGGKDLQVPADSNLKAAAAAFAEGHVPGFTLVKLAGLNHLFQTAKTGNITEYSRIDETISPRALEAIASWLRLNVR